MSSKELFATLWIVAHHVPLSGGLSRPEYWSGLPCPFAGDLLNPGIEPGGLMSPTLASSSLTTSATGEALASMQGPLFEEDDLAVGSLENLFWARMVRNLSQF